MLQADVSGEIALSIRRHPWLDPGVPRQLSWDAHGSNAWADSPRACPMAASHNPPALARRLFGRSRQSQAGIRLIETLPQLVCQGADIGLGGDRPVVPRDHPQDGFGLDQLAPA